MELTREERKLHEQLQVEYIHTSAYECPYRERGCAHADNCRRFGRGVMHCPFRKYFVELDKFWIKRHGERHVEVLEEELKEVPA